MSYSILITGDLVVNKLYEESNIGKDLINLFKQANLRIVNLEAPVTDSSSKITKTGPHLKAHRESTLNVVKALNVDMVTLANNHILDYDEHGVKDTLAFCKENEIQTVGAGMNLEEASKPLFIETDEGNIAFVNFTENEWTCATEDTAGANPMDLINNFKQIQEARQTADFVIVIVHGGNEYNHYPSPRMVKQYRFYAENGADAVIGHHTHCISGYETHNNVPILYSLGNFLFTKNNPKDVWYHGLVATLNIKRRKNIGFVITPVVQSKDSHKLSLTDGGNKDSITTHINEINQVIADKFKLEEKWGEFIRKVEPGFIKGISPMAGIDNKYIKAALYKSGIYKFLLNPSYLKEHLNRIRCEAHSDIVKEVLQRKLYKK